MLPKMLLHARNLTRDAKLLWAVLMSYAWQDEQCFPGYERLCHDLGASDNMVRKYMRELEAAGLLRQERRGQGRTNLYYLTDLRTARIEVQEPQFLRTSKTEVPDPQFRVRPEPQKAPATKTQRTKTQHGKKQGQIFRTAAEEIAEERRRLGLS